MRTRPCSPTHPQPPDRPPPPPGRRRPTASASPPATALADPEGATTHGLFARDVVLPHLGEDPDAYEALLDALTRQTKPRDLLEQHYTEKIAAASWRLRRLQRWQAQLFEDPDITEDQALQRLDRVLRHETALHRQIDTSVKMLGRDVPALFEGRARRHALAFAEVTERDCREDEEWDWQIEINAREQLAKLTPRPPLDPARLDAQPTGCRNGPAPASPPSPPASGAGGPSPSPCPEGEVARDEPEGVLTEAAPAPTALGTGGGARAGFAYRCHKDLSHAIRPVGPVTPRDVTILTKRTHAETLPSGQRPGEALTGSGPR